MLGFIFEIEVFPRRLATCGLSISDSLNCRRSRLITSGCSSLGALLPSLWIPDPWNCPLSFPALCNHTHAGPFCPGFFFLGPPACQYTMCVVRAAPSTLGIPVPYGDPMLPPAGGFREVVLLYFRLIFLGLGILENPVPPLFFSWPPRGHDWPGGRPTQQL